MSINHNNDEFFLEAVTAGNTDKVQALLKEGKVNINAFNENGISALMIAAIKGYATIVDILVTYPELDINAKMSGGWSALLLAIRLSHPKIVASLMGNERLDINTTNDAGANPLMLATSQEKPNSDILELLFTHKFLDVNAVNPMGANAMIFAAISGNSIAANSLKNHKDLKIHATDNNDLTALDHAFLFYKKDVIDSLINTADENGDAALMLAAESGKYDWTLLLLEYGANPTMVNKDKKSALTIANEKHQQKLATLIEKAIHESQADSVHSETNHLEEIFSETIAPPMPEQISAAQEEVQENDTVEMVGVTSPLPL